MSTSTTLPKILPTSVTPKGTIVTCRCLNDETGETEVFTKYLIDYAGGPTQSCIRAADSLLANGTYLCHDIFFDFEIDVYRDIQARAFRNAPDEYKWFAIDPDGLGYVFENKPECSISLLTGEIGWHPQEEDIRQVNRVYPAKIRVGVFEQYKPFYQDILIEREGN